VPTSNIPDLPDGLPPWLAAFISEALRETDTLRENGADQAALARMALLKKLVAAAAAWLNAELDTVKAAGETGRTISACAAATCRSLLPPSPARMIPVPMPRTSPGSGGRYDPEVLDQVPRRTRPPDPVV